MKKKYSDGTISVLFWYYVRTFIKYSPHLPGPAYPFVYIPSIKLGINCFMPWLFADVR